MPYHPDDASAGNQLVESLLDVVEPFLPSSLIRPLHQLLTLPWIQLLSSPTSLISLLLSLFAIYTALMSMYNTTRFAFRLTWFIAKWSALIGAIAVGWNGYTNGWSGTTRSLDTMQGMAKTTWDVGKTGAQWWFGNHAGSGSASGSRKKSSPSRVKRNTRRSANGRPRTWATTTDEGGWDDPAEVDLGGEYGARGAKAGAGAGGSGEDAWKTARDTFFSFMGSSGSRGDDTASSSKDKKKRSAQPKVKSRTQPKARSDEIPGGWAMKYAMNQAKKVWDDATGASSTALLSGKDNRRRNR
ncbi:BQ2448_6141 [Microbotryum intermedium]|uniref:BQ2448_6141 protein n=1 Tax=Microbotryum intermedium TaxID=269621 RepID=A0A238FNG3_9BASI|nr:BQ2448_6141 [Microbotryum intermedium]